MPNTRLRVRKGDPETISVDQGLTAVSFTNGIANHSSLAGAGGADDLSALLAQFPEVEELGRPALYIATSDDLSAESEITVPTGKYWRVISIILNYTASADAATRAPTITLEPAGEDPISLSATTKTANQVETDTFLAGSDAAISGNFAVAAQGTLTIAEPVTDGDTFTIGDRTYTFVADDDGSVTNAIPIGASEAETKTNLEAVFVDGDHPDVNAVAFATDDMVFTARTPGYEGDSIVFVEGTLTHVSNVLDGSGTLGGTTAGSGPSTDYTADIDFPTLGPLLRPADVIALNVTNGHANDEAQLYVTVLEFDNNPAA